MLFQLFPICVQGWSRKVWRIPRKERRGLPTTKGFKQNITTKVSEIKSCMLTTLLGGGAWDLGYEVVSELVTLQNCETPSNFIDIDHVQNGFLARWKTSEERAQILSGIPEHEQKRRRYTKWPYNIGAQWSNGNMLGLPTATFPFGSFDGCVHQLHLNLI